MEKKRKTMLEKNRKTKGRKGKQKKEKRKKSYNTQAGYSSHGLLGVSINLYWRTDGFLKSKKPCFSVIYQKLEDFFFQFFFVIHGP